MADLSGVAPVKESQHDAQMNGKTGAAADGSDPRVPDVATVMQKYTQEAEKRIRYRPDGLAHYAELKTAESARFKSLATDPWADHDALNARDPPALGDGQRVKVVILGGGFGALITAVRLIQAGLAAKDIRFVDSAGGFGGTWYWNRYPGLHCDVEAYCYLPFLEETGYVPATKYSPGHEILEHSNRIAQHWDLADKALFRAEVNALTWDDNDKAWTVSLKEGRGPGQDARNFKVQAQYFVIASGVLSRPQAPKIPGLESFAGNMFHTARWDYTTTGGTPTAPDMTKLKDKRVGIIGTGATAVQVVPELAKHAKELYVFQRTPSAVSPRGQRPTDREEWRTKIAAKKGWQAERVSNLTRILSNSAEPDEPDLVDDWWTKIASYHATLGSTRRPPPAPTPAAIQAHIGEFVALDLPHAEGTRARVDSIVRDKDTAAKLKAWYPSWCKRPTFSDSYLQAFNLPNVHLVDTDGRGLDSATAEGLVFDGTAYPLDVLVLSTGFIAPSPGRAGGGDPASKSGIALAGRGGASMEAKWRRQGVTTLHGVMSNGFPNLFLLSPFQGGSAPNNVHMLDVQAEHVAYMVGEAERRPDRDGAVVEATTAAEEAWAVECLKGATYYTTMPICTPGYVTAEGEGAGDVLSAEETMKKARASPMADGLVGYVRRLVEWRKAGTLEGVLIS